MDTVDVMTSKLGVKYNFSATEAFVSNQNLTSIGQLVVLFAGVAILRLPHCVTEVPNNVTHSFFYVANNIFLT